MKTTILKGFGATALIFALIAFKSNTVEKKKIDVNESKVEWTGEKLTGSHNGTIQFKDGYLLMDGEKITGGKFTIDMNTITVTDLSGEGKQKLEGHLNSDDFFGVNNYDTATLEIKNAAKKGNVYGITGDLTIKGKTNPITFDLKMEGDSATTTLTVDRTKYGIRYGSGSFFDNLGDNTIYDEFKLDVSLKF